MHPSFSFSFHFCFVKPFCTVEAVELILLTYWSYLLETKKEMFPKLRKVSTGEKLWVRGKPLQTGIFLKPDFTQTESLNWSDFLVPLFLYEAVPEHQSPYD